MDRINTQSHLEGSGVRPARKSGRMPRLRRLAPMVVWVDGQECVKIPLNDGMFAIVDMDDAESILSHRWYAQKNKHTWYAARSEQRNYKRTHFYMHRQILQCPDGVDGDHDNRNGLDNRRRNLKILPRSLNLSKRRMGKMSSGGYRGVYRSVHGSFYAKIKRQHLGTFQTAAEAAIAFNLAAIKRWGEFAQLNVIGADSSKSS